MFIEVFLVFYQFSNFLLDSFLSSILSKCGEKLDTATKISYVSLRNHTDASTNDFFCSKRIICSNYNYLKPSISEKQPTGLFSKRTVLKKFSKFTGKHLCWSHFSIKFQAFRLATLLKRDSNAESFLWKMQDFLKTPILKNICERLLLY